MITNVFIFFAEIVAGVTFLNFRHSWSNLGSENIAMKSIGNNNWDTYPSCIVEIKLKLWKEWGYEFSSPLYGLALAKISKVLYITFSNWQIAN